VIEMYELGFGVSMVYIMMGLVLAMSWLKEKRVRNAG